MRERQGEKGRQRQGAYREGERERGRERWRKSTRQCVRKIVISYVKHQEKRKKSQSG